MYGWTDKNQLVKWDSEDVDRLYKSLWLKDYIIPKFTNKEEEEQYYIKLAKALFATLPKRELNIFDDRLSKIDIVGNRSRFHTIIRCTVIDMQQKLNAHSYHKEQLLKGVPIQPKKEITFNEFRKMQQQKQSKYLSYDYLKYFVPIEILEHVGFKLIKYDIIKGNYYITLQFPDELKKEPIVLYDTNPTTLESKGERLFETEIEEYLKSKSNPYGDKSFATVDISNIENVMNAGGEDPLATDDIF